MGHVGKLDLLKALGELLRLAIPSTFVWLITFYVYFHCTLNLFAEITRFGDRLFFKDWWNCTSFSRYWRTWNLPVHQFLVRHVYFPLLRAGASKMTANVTVFAVSAFFHELLISVGRQGSSRGGVEKGRERGRERGREDKRSQTDTFS
ncbi:diacylglycerol acyltransferase [Nannochloropsis gaditana]|uniref:diacylglycerol O-acyltransferase n=1 Tax=Nannochloropsis gaditana TaxID=72520 RepID=W7TT63_9STRA|nr:diacylglycerol acyltransferase [Nannochloropsis gaditana]